MTDIVDTNNIANIINKTNRADKANTIKTINTTNTTNTANTTVLAYLGDAVYELKIREMLIDREESLRANSLHRKATRYVSARGQAAAVKNLMKDFLSDEELSLVKRARNHKTSSHPRGADPVEYKLATGFEALIGELYLKGEMDRINEIVEIAVNIIDGE